MIGEYFPYLWPRGDSYLLRGVFFGSFKQKHKCYLALKRQYQASEQQRRNTALALSLTGDTWSTQTGLATQRKCHWQVEIQPVNPHVTARGETRVPWQTRVTHEAELCPFSGVLIFTAKCQVIGSFSYGACSFICLSSSRCRIWQSDFA